MNDLFILAINLTRRCNLACAHCYMDAETRLGGGQEELTAGEVTGLLDRIAARGDETMVVLTGGEPLLRRDLEQLINHGSRLGLSMVVGSNGVLLDDRRVDSLKAAGLMGIGISLDSLDPAVHDRFRGCPGSWEKTLAGIERCRQRELPLQIHFSVTERNAHEIQSMIDFAKAVGAHVLNAFFLVCTGRGESMSDITPTRYEQVLTELLEAQSAHDDLIIRARCAPHYKRIAYQRDPDSPLTRAQGYEGGGCLAGSHYCRITPEGGVTACPYIADEEASIREQDFWEIWDGAPGFHRLRNPQLGGNCGRCEFRALCGGCRARPLAMGGALLDADPWCNYVPGGGPVINAPMEDAEPPVRWAADAEQRLSRVPGFLRKMVRKRAESHVRGLGEDMVTSDHMTTLAARRFGESFPSGRPGAKSGEANLSSPEANPLPWTEEARDYLERMPVFLRDGVRQVAEEVALGEGRMEVNVGLLRRLEVEDQASRALPWEQAAEQLLDDFIALRHPLAAVFARPGIESAAERETRRRGGDQVSAEDVRLACETGTAGVAWDHEALSRVSAAPDFIRAGIKKAAEFAARREGLSRITSEDLTRFRNRAMMRAVRRLKGFGMNELDFEGFEIARARVPRLKENRQAERRFAAIRNHVTKNQADDGGGLGVLDQQLMQRMRDSLRKPDG